MSSSPVVFLSKVTVSSVALNASQFLPPTVTSHTSICVEIRSFACMVLLYSVGAVLLEQAWEARMYNTVHGNRGSTQKRQRRR